MLLKLSLNNDTILLCVWVCGGVTTLPLDHAASGSLDPTLTTCSSAGEHLRPLRAPPYGQLHARDQDAEDEEEEDDQSYQERREAVHPIEPV